jgi:chromate reductase
MATRTVAVLVGSLRKDSYNRKLGQALARLAAPALDFTFIEIGDLPLYNQDLDGAYPPAATRLKEQVRAADAVLFLTPEYNRAIPGVLKNAIDWGSRPYGKSAWAGKPAAIAGASVGAVGTAVAQQQLRAVLGYLDMPTLGQPEVFIHFRDGLIDDQGSITNEGTQKFLQGFVTKFTAWIELVSPAKA